MIRILLCLISALLLTLSFPTFDLGFLAWIALIPQLLAIRNISLKSAFALSWISGTAFFMGALSWINSVKGVTLLHSSIMGVYLGLYFVIFGVFLNMIHKRSRFPFVVTAPALWVTAEYLRSQAGAFGFPFALLGHTQHHNLPLIQLASFTGAYGVSFVVVMANAAIADLLVYLLSPSPPSLSRQGRGRFVFNPLHRGGFVLAIILVLWIVGWQVIPRNLSGKPFSVAVVQGNIPPDVKWKREHRDQILSKYENLSEGVARLRPRLIVWPEASTPGFALKDLSLYSQLSQMVRRFNTYVVLGSAEYPKFSKTKVKFGKTGNTALLFSPEGKVISQYLKIRLLPFGEYVPYEGVIPWPKFIVAPSTNSHIAGTEAVLFGIEGAKFGILICSEMMYPDLSRAMVKKGAVFLLNLSNEGWFGKGSFPYQFLSLCIFRAVENRVNVVRCTNTGISGFIDPYGRITAKVTNEGQDIFVEGALTQDIFLSPPGTFYTHHGDILAYGCIAFSIGLVVWSMVKKRFIGGAK